MSLWQIIQFIFLVGAVPASILIGYYFGRSSVEVEAIIERVNQSIDEDRERRND